MQDPSHLLSFHHPTEYGCETWCLILREERANEGVERTLLKRIFVPVREKLAGDCTELHIVKLRNFYSSLATVWLQNLIEISRACSNHEREDRCTEGNLKQEKARSY